jgi:hypothetical protein
MAHDVATAADRGRRVNTDIPVGTRVAILFAHNSMLRGDTLPHGAYTAVALTYECDRTFLDAAGLV